MTFRGVIKNGRVEFPDGGPELPNGTPVDVQPAPKKARATKGPAKRRRSVSKDPLYNLGQLAVDTGRVDGAMQHDHYAYGTPKRKLTKREQQLIKRKAR